MPKLIQVMKLQHLWADLPASGGITRMGLRRSRASSPLAGEHVGLSMRPQWSAIQEPLGKSRAALHLAASVQGFPHRGPWR